MILIGVIVVLLILVAGVGAYSYNQYSTNKKLTDELELRRSTADEKDAALMAKVEEVKTLQARIQTAEEAGVVSENKLAAARDELAARNDELRVLKDQLQLEIDRKAEIQQLLGAQIAGLEADNAAKAVDIATARKAMYEVDDYILEKYLGDDREAILKLRRLRDLMLLNLHHARKGMCDIVKGQDRFKLITSALDRYQALSISLRSKAMNIFTILKSGVSTGDYYKFPGWDSAHNDIRQVPTSEFTTIVSDGRTAASQMEMNMVVACNTDSTCKAFNLDRWTKHTIKPVYEWNQYNGTLYIKISEFEDVANRSLAPYNMTYEQMMIIYMLNRECSNSTMNIQGAMNQLRSGTPHSNTGDWTALIDYIEGIVMDAATKFCPSGQLNVDHTVAVVEKLARLMCRDDNTAEFNGLAHKPLDYVLAKTYKIFMP